MLRGGVGRGSRRAVPFPQFQKAAATCVPCRPCGPCRPFLNCALHSKTGELRYAEHGLRIVGQVRERFWSYKSIRPDVVATFNHATGSERVILDTKWKVPRDGEPADDDLKQMYAYNVHPRRYVAACWCIQRQGRTKLAPMIPTPQSASLPPDRPHGCATFYINLFDANLRLRGDIGSELIQKAILNSSTKWLAPEKTK